MPILNYTTKIPVEKTISEIESLLSKSGANKILKEYDTESNITSVSFIINTDQGSLPFKLPMNQQAVMGVINQQIGEYRRQASGKQVRMVPPIFRNDFEQARRVGWRIIKDWLEAQLALFFLQMVKMEEIFLPYLYDEKTNKTMFQKLEEKGFQLQLENKVEPEVPDENNNL